MKKHAEYLQSARDKIADPAHWTKRTFASDEFGKPCNEFSSHSVRWCALGSLRVACGEYSVKNYRLLDALRTKLNTIAIDHFTSNGIIAVNDDLGHAAVLELYDIAIRREKTK